MIQKVSMNRRAALLLIAGLTTATLNSGISSAQQTADTPYAQWVEKVLEEMKRIKSGMSRADLLKLFKTEGGLSTGLQRTFVSRHCEYFKVDVTFRAVGRADKDAQGRVTLVEDYRDRIVSISRPYLDFAVMD